MRPRKSRDPSPPINDAADSHQANEAVASSTIPDGRVDGVPAGKLVGAVVGAIKILRILAEIREPLGVSRIAKEAGLNTSTTFNTLRTMVAYDFVQFDRLTKTYGLSLGIMEIARAATAVGGEVSAVLPVMERVANTHGVTITLWQPVRTDRKILIMAAHARSAMRIQMAVGQRLPLLIGSTGRLFAAFGDLSERELWHQFKAIRWEGPLTFEMFMAEVAKARQDGWAADYGNFAAGTVLLSAPVLDRNGHAVMAITANMFAGQYDSRRAVDIIADLRAFCDHAARVVAS